MSVEEPAERRIEAGSLEPAGSATATAAQSPARRRFRRPAIFYGWWVVLAGAAMMTLMGAFSYYGMGVFFNSIREDLGWNAAALGAALSLARIQGGVLAPAVGMLIDRYGSRRLVLVGVLMTGSGFVLLGQTMSIIYFYIVFIFLVQGGISAGMGNAPTAAVANWFFSPTRHRARCDEPRDQPRRHPREAARRDHHGVRMAHGVRARRSDGLGRGAPARVRDPAPARGPRLPAGRRRARGCGRRARLCSHREQRRLDGHGRAAAGRHVLAEASAPDASVLEHRADVLRAPLRDGLGGAVPDPAAPGAWDVAHGRGDDPQHDGVDRHARPRRASPGWATAWTSGR